MLWFWSWVSTETPMFEDLILSFTLMWPIAELLRLNSIGKTQDIRSFCFWTSFWFCFLLFTVSMHVHVHLFAFVQVERHVCTCVWKYQDNLRCDSKSVCPIWFLKMGFLQARISTYLLGFLRSIIHGSTFTFPVLKMQGHFTMPRFSFCLSHPYPSRYVGDLNPGPQLCESDAFIESSP